MAKFQDYVKENSAEYDDIGVTTEDQGLGANRGPVGEIIEAVAESPVGQVLGATRKAEQ